MANKGLGRAGRGNGWAVRLPAFATSALLLSALALPALLLALLLAAPAPADAKSPRGRAAQAEQPADAPVRKLLTLLTRKGTGKDDLRKMETELERARSASADPQNWAKATFFLGRTQEEIAKRTGLKADWYHAADTFGSCVDRAPTHTLAPDALLHRGLIRLQRLSDPEGAAADFQAIGRSYPRSNLVKRAGQLLARVQKSGGGKKTAPEPPRAQTAAPSPSPGATPDRPMLLEVRPKNSGASARVVLDLDAKVKYRYQLLEHPGGKSDAGRIYVDLIGAEARPGLDDDMQLSGGILKRVRVAPKSGDAIRVVLDLHTVRDYRVTVLDAPYRIVVDAFSSQEAKAATPAPVNAQEPPQAPSFAAPKGPRKKLAADLVEQLGLSVRTVMLDAGHGGKDPGARGHGLDEKDVNLRMVLLLGKMLKAEGYRVLYTRTTDDFLGLDERTNLANAKKADLFISIHCNAHTDPSMQGLETYSLNLAKTPDAVRVAARENSVSDKNISDLQMILTDLMLTSKIKESVDLAHGVHRRGLNAIRDKWRVLDHGNREAPFYVLMGAKMPSALIEIGYITNKTEAARLNSAAYLKALATGIVSGINEYKQQLERYTGK